MGKILSLQLKSTKSPDHEIELFDSIQYISCRIKAAGGCNMLGANEEYIALIAKHLTNENKLRWVTTGASDWQSFYSFLVNLTTYAHCIQVLRDVSSGFAVPHPPKTCKHCNGDYASRFCKKQKPKTAKVLTVWDKKTCQACGQEAHPVQLWDGKSIASNLRLSSSRLTMLGRRSCSNKSGTRSTGSANTVCPSTTRQKPG